MALSLKTLARWWVLACFAVLPIHGAGGEPGSIDVLSGIRYEYRNQGPGTDLILMVPGFTQHNRSREFVLLRDHFMARGFSVLIMNPPQHGEDYQYSGIYAWGEREDTALAFLVEALKLRSGHGRIHALGFSIGAKTVIRFAALPQIADALTSVMAVAPPYRVSDINVLVSGDISRPMEGAISAGKAMGRAGLVRMVYMGLGGMTKALFDNRATPAREISKVKAPLLLLHGSADWLIKSNHSERLFERIGSAQPAALVILKTRTHAEDMLSRDHASLRTGLLAVMDQWMDLANAMADHGKGLPSRDSLQTAFQAMLDTVPWVGENRVSRERISLLDRPTLFSPLNGLWYSAPNEHPALAGAHYSRVLEDGGRDRLLLDLAPRRGRNSWTSLSASLSLTDSGGFRNPEAEIGLSYHCCPRGPLLFLRRIGIWSGINGDSQRRILSADFSLYQFEVQMNYGRFFSGREDVGMDLSFPLIGNAASSYFLGVGYEVFFTDPGSASDRDGAQAYFVWGPTRAWLETRPRITLQYQQEGPASKGWNPRLALGLSLSLFER